MTFIFQLQRNSQNILPVPLSLKCPGLSRTLILSSCNYKSDYKQAQKGNWRYSKGFSNTFCFLEFVEKEPLLVYTEKVFSLKQNFKTCTYQKLPVSPKSHACWELSKLIVPIHLESTRLEKAMLQLKMLRLQRIGFPNH